MLFSRYQCPPWCHLWKLWKWATASTETPTTIWSTLLMSRRPHTIWCSTLALWWERSVSSDSTIMTSVCSRYEPNAWGLNLQVNMLLKCVLMMLNDGNDDYLGNGWLVCSLPQHWLTELEILAMVFAAAIHDFEHTGTTNNFHIQTRCVMTSNKKQPIISAAIMMLCVLYEDNWPASKHTITSSIMI